MSQRTAYELSQDHPEPCAAVGIIPVTGQLWLVLTAAFIACAVPRTHDKVLREKNKAFKMTDMMLGL